MATYGISKNHVIAANEGNAVALAAGYHLATGKVLWCTFKTAVKAIL
jgi:phosphonopyruvate decarboxylase